MPPKLDPKGQGHEDDPASLTTAKEVESPAQKANNGVSPPDAAASTASSSTADAGDSEDNDKKRFKLSVPDNAGTLLICGGINWDLTGRRELPKHVKNKPSGVQNLWGPHRMGSLGDIKISYVASGCCACHSVLISQEGKAMTLGRNDKGELGHGDILRRDTPTIVDALKDETIVSAACGRNHTLFLNERGIVYSCGDNKMGQCGNGSQNQPVNIPTRISFRRPVVKVACGAEFSMIVDFKGHLFSFGCPEHGQLGHNTDGQYLVRGNKLSFQCELVPRRLCLYIEKSPRDSHIEPIDDVCIIDMACGANHTVAVDSKKRCYSWGFGGYGRLGHAEPKNEMLPRLVKAFDVSGVKMVFAGGSFSMAVDSHDMLYFWGQNKKSGEATMYPKPVHDVTGWHIRDIGCAHTSIVVVADEGVAAWGPSPTYGELGYGDFKLKSSSTPQEVKLLDGLSIYSVACGYGHSMFIAPDKTEDEQKLLGKLPEYSAP